MSFLKGIPDTITVPVTAYISIVGQDPIEVPFRVTYKNNTSPKRVLQFAKDIREGGAYPEDPIRDSIAGWSELYGEDGQEIGYSDEALEEMLNSLPYLEALFNGWVEANSNSGAQKQKNS